MKALLSRRTAVLTPAFATAWYALGTESTNQAQAQPANSALRVAAASIGPSDGNLDRSLAEATRAVERAAGGGAKLVVLPELFALPYTASASPEAWPIKPETLDGPTASWARKTAMANNISIVLSMPLAQPAGKPVNAAILARPSGTVDQVATKRNLPPKSGDEKFGEADHFARGESDVRSFEVDGIKLAVLICYDRRIPDRWKAAVQAGADVVLIPVAGPAPQDPPDLYMKQLRGFAKDNDMFVIASARSGEEAVLGYKVKHDGVCAAVDRAGIVQAEAKGHHDDLIFLNVTKRS